jgi:hypothetical protein
MRDFGVFRQKYGLLEPWILSIGGGVLHPTLSADLRKPPILHRFGLSGLSFRRIGIWNISRGVIPFWSVWRLQYANQLMIMQETESKVTVIFTMMMVFLVLRIQEK